LKFGHDTNLFNKSCFCTPDFVSSYLLKFRLDSFQILRVCPAYDKYLISCNLELNNHG
jgi:hypothetical protein